MAAPGFPGEEAVLEAWRRYRGGEADAIEDAYQLVFPFCLRVAGKTCGRFVTGEDEEASIARMAFLEAFEQYEPERGPLFVYVGRVVRSRLIDYGRREKKQRTIPFSSFFDGEREREWAEDSDLESVLLEMARSQEIERLAAMLQACGISFADVARASPKHWSVRQAVRQVAAILSADEELMNHLLQSGELPLRKLEKEYGLNRKMMERHRKFIIAVAFILYFDLECLKEYVSP